MLLGKIAPSFKTILGNSEGPLMDLFSEFTRRTDKPRSLHPSDRVTRSGAGDANIERSAAAPAAERITLPASRSSRSPVNTPEEAKP
jgi:hypothetical protein